LQYILTYRPAIEIILRVSNSKVCCPSLDAKDLHGGLSFLAARSFPPTTAAIRPELFPEQFLFAGNRRLVVAILALLLAAGFAFRVCGLGSESLGEDEFNKLETVAEYRQNGLSSKNGEHPFLMKGLQTVSIIASEKLNASTAANISEEAALRFPVALFGTFSALLLFLLVSELFGSSIGLVSAALWSVEPMAIGFDRVAKEDSLVLFFFLLAALLWIKGQTASERGRSDWLKWVWRSAAAFGAMLASKYYLPLLGIAASYYHAFNRLPGKHWAIGKPRWRLFLVIMGATLLVLSPPLFLPDTWREMLKFSSEGRVGHDSYEFMGGLYLHTASAWLKGVPWYFYYVLAGTKTSLTTLLFFIPGALLVFRKKMGDGRIFIFFWIWIWYLPVSLLGGKFTRYFTVSEPVVLIMSAVGFCLAARWLADRLPVSTVGKAAFQLVLLAALLVLPVMDSISASPHYRLFTNPIGGGMAAAGTIFPHDEFYDASTREVMAAIASRARNGAAVACETPGLFKHYAEKAGRADLMFVTLSDKAKVKEMQEGDVIVLTTGRRYFSNQAYFETLRKQPPTAETDIRGAVSSQIYQLDADSIAAVRAIAGQ
jgi:Dolichyl-phosphate-mannose-protein mannosyltransferase